MTQSDVSLNRDSNGHKNRSCHSNVTHRMDHVGEQVSVCVRGHVKCSKGILNSTKDDV